MQEHVTLLGPSELPSDGRGLSSSLPPDLIEQIRGRVRLLALLLLIAFSFDPLIYFAMWAIATVAGYPVILGQLGFRLLDLGAVAASGALWWAARQRAVPADRLHTLGLLYQVAICFMLALTTFWQTGRESGGPDTSRFGPEHRNNRDTHTRRQVHHAVPESTDRAFQPAGAEAG